MSEGPDPAMVADWFTWGGVLFVAAIVVLVWVTVYILTPKRPPAPVAVSFPVSPCAPHGHRYVAQPVTWRCATCGDERVVELYEENVA